MPFTSTDCGYVPHYMRDFLMTQENLIWYKSNWTWRCFQAYMDSEIRAIMAQYMPLDSQSESRHHLQDDA
jgi:hypothetical protein